MLLPSQGQEVILPTIRYPAPIRAKAITKKRLSKDERSQLKIESPLNDIIIGLLLGDGHIQKRSSKGNSRFIYGQSSTRLQHLNYFKHVLEIFKPYVSKDFKLKNRTSTALDSYPEGKTTPLQFSSSENLGSIVSCPRRGDLCFCLCKNKGKRGKSKGPRGVKTLGERKLGFPPLPIYTEDSSKEKSFPPKWDSGKQTSTR